MHNPIAFMELTGNGNVELRGKKLARLENGIGG